MNHLEQLVGEWLQYKRYFVRLSVPVGARLNGGYEGELDVVAYNFATQHLLHIECSLDCDSIAKREKRFGAKMERGRRYIREVFPGVSLPEPDQRIVLQFPNAHIREIAGVQVVPVCDLVHEIYEGLDGTSPESGAVSSTLPLIRTLQLAAHGNKRGDGGARCLSRQ